MPLTTKGHSMFFNLILLLFFLVLLGAIPVWPHSRNWSYYPSGGLSLVLLILLILMLTGHVN